MQQSLLPSKKFIIRLLVLIGLGLLILGIDRGVAYYKKVRTAKQQTEEIHVPLVSLGSLSDKDTDGDGIPDWEELLWGLDPTKKDTDGDGVSDKETLTKKKIALEQNNQTSSEQNESDAFVQNFFTALLTLKNSGNLTKENMQVVIDELQKSIGEKKYLPDTYTAKTSVTTGNTEKNKLAFKTKILKVLAEEKYSSLGSETEAIEKMLTENNDGGSLIYLSNLYIDLAKRIALIPIPTQGVQTQILLTNTLHNIGVSLKNIQQIKTNPIIALEGLGQYTEYSKKLTEVEQALGAYMKQ